MTGTSVPTNTATRALSPIAIALRQRTLALVASKQFDVIFEVPYRGTEEEIVSLLNRCESLNAAIARAPNAESLVLVVQIIDACLVNNLPTAELRSLIRTVIDRDPLLINHMPTIKSMLHRVYRAVTLSVMLQPSTIRQIAMDVASRNSLGAVQ
jgi:hypothetical protein